MKQGPWHFYHLTLLWSAKLGLQLLEFPARPSGGYSPNWWKVHFLTGCLFFLLLSIRPPNRRADGNATESFYVIDFFPSVPTCCNPPLLQAYIFVQHSSPPTGWSKSTSVFKALPVPPLPLSPPLSRFRFRLRAAPELCQKRGWGSCRYRRTNDEYVKNRNTLDNFQIPVTIVLISTEIALVAIAASCLMVKLWLKGLFWGSGSAHYSQRFVKSSSILHNDFHKLLQIA